MTKPRDWLDGIDISDFEKRVFDGVWFLSVEDFDELVGELVNMGKTLSPRVTSSLTFIRERKKALLLERIPEDVEQALENMRERETLANAVTFMMEDENWH